MTGDLHTVREGEFDDGRWVLVTAVSSQSVHVRYRVMDGKLGVRWKVPERPLARVFLCLALQQAMRAGGTCPYYVSIAADFDDYQNFALQSSHPRETQVCGHREIPHAQTLLTPARHLGQEYPCRNLNEQAHDLGR